MKIKKNILYAILICFLFTTVLGTQVFADTDDFSLSSFVPIYSDTVENMESVHVIYPSVTKEQFEWDFPYSDDLFNIPDDMYCHKLAQASLGMTVSAFRPNVDTELSQHADNIKQYFENVGFTDVEADSYLTEPAVDTIATAIAHKDMNGFTVVAVVPCGANYKKEWGSNLLVGDEERHVGFNNAAQTVEQRIKDYIEKYGLSGDLRLWTSGFSRAAAVSNIVAADMTDSKLFTRVYAYSFATPRTTRDPKDYDNIFCIIGKDDPVPAIPFADWGYDHYGTELYTPTQEGDSDFIDKVYQASDVMQQISGAHYYNNPELISQLRIVFDYLLNLLPNPTKYVNTIQDALVAAMGGGDYDFESAISTILTEFEPQNEDEEIEIQSLYDFMQMLANEYLLQGNEKQVEEGSWNTERGIGINIFLEHNPDDYISWMFSSDDPEKIFGQNIKFSVVIFGAAVDVTIYDQNGFVMETDSKGKTVTAEERSEEREEGHTAPSLFSIVKSGQLNLTIPLDRMYVIVVKPLEKQDTLTSVITYSNDSIKGTVDLLTGGETDEDKEYFFLYDGEGFWDLYDNEGISVESIRGTDDEFFGEYSPSVLMRLQNLNSNHLTIVELLGVAIVFFLLFAVILLVSAILTIIRLLRKKKRKTIPTIILHIISILMLVLFELGAWYFVPAFPVTRTVFQVLAYIFILLLGIKALTTKKRKKDIIILIIIFVIMVLAACLEPNYIGRISTLKMCIVFGIDMVMVAAACFMWRNAKEISEDLQSDDNCDIETEPTDNNEDI